MIWSIKYLHGSRRDVPVWVRFYHIRRRGHYCSNDKTTCFFLIPWIFSVLRLEPSVFLWWVSPLVSHQQAGKERMDSFQGTLESYSAHSLDLYLNTENHFAVSEPDTGYHLTQMILWVFWTECSFIARCYPFSSHFIYSHAQFQAPVLTNMVLTRL